MDKLINAGKDFLEDRLQDKDEDEKKKQQQHGGGSSGGGFFDRDDDDDFREAKEQADKHAGSSGNSDLFSSIISAIGQKKNRLAEEDLDEEGQLRHLVEDTPSFCDLVRLTWLQMRRRSTRRRMRTTTTMRMRTSSVPRLRCRPSSCSTLARRGRSRARELCWVLPCLRPARYVRS